MATGTTPTSFPQAYASAIPDNALPKVTRNTEEAYLYAPCIKVGVQSGLEADWEGVRADADWKQHGIAQTIYKIVVLAPKYICCGIGWTLGFAYSGNNVGAGLGAAAGAFVGSLISFLLIELIVGRLLGFDSTLQESDITALAIDRLKSAVIFAAGCFVAGSTFNFFANQLPATIGSSSPYLSFFTTMGGSALAYTAGATGARFLGYLYNYKEIDFDIICENVKNDLQTGVCLIGPANGMFAALCPPRLVHGAKMLSRHTWEMLWPSGRAMLAGGAVGVLLDQGVTKCREQVFIIEREQAVQTFTVECEESVGDLSDLPPYVRALDGPCTCEECMPPAESDSDEVEGVNGAPSQSRSEVRKAQLAEHFRRREQRAQLRRQRKRAAVIPA